MARRFHTAAIILALAAVYFCFGKFGLSVTSAKSGVLPVLPPTGIALAAILLWGRRLWPGIFIGAFLVEVTAQGSIVAALGVAAGNTLEALIVAALVRKLAGGLKAFEKSQTIFKFIVPCTFVGAFIGASLGVASLCLGGQVAWSRYVPDWFAWWLGDTAGILIVTPLLIIWATERFGKFKLGQIVEAAVLLVTVVWIGKIVFLGRSAFAMSGQMEYLAIPPLLWAAFRFGRRGATACIFILSVFAVFGALHQRGLFAISDRNESLLLLQACLGIITVLALILAALISERKKTGDALCASEMRFQQVTESIKEVFWMTDSDKNKMLYISRAYEEIWGRSCESLYASPRNWVDALHPDDRERVLQAALSKQVSGQYDETYRIIRPDGTTRWIHDRAFPVRDESGKNSQVVGVAEDITARKLAETNLTMLGHAIESTSEMIWITDLQGHFVFTNRAFLQNHDYTEAEIFGKTPDIIFSQKNPPELIQEILKQTHFDGWRGEVLARRKDGTEFSIYLSSSLIQGQNGRIFGLMGISQDISERNRVQSWLMELAAIVEHSDDAIISKTLDGVIVSWNKAAERIYGYTAQEAIGRSISILTPADRDNEFELTDILKRIRQGEWTVNLETTRRRKDGSMIDVSLTTSPVRDRTGRITGASVVARDITLRKRLEKKLLEISADERRRLGHDLHDGLGQFLLGIALKAKLLEETLTKEKSPQALRARDVVGLMNTAITQTRNLAHGLDPIYVEAHGLVAALRSLAAQTRELLQVECIFACKQEQLDVNTETGIAFYRIAQEAIQNAVRHGQARRINLELVADDTQLRLKICDDGKGFAPNDKSFSGMGLHIMQFRISSIGGHLAIDSEPGKGAQIECTVAGKLWLATSEKKELT
jgi:PAS domain S-box-containing protein